MRIYLNRPRVFWCAAFNCWAVRSRGPSATFPAALHLAGELGWDGAVRIAYELVAIQRAQIDRILDRNGLFAELWPHWKGASYRRAAGR